jgi:hypothetical protein
MNEKLIEAVAFEAATNAYCASIGHRSDTSGILRVARDNAIRAAITAYEAAKGVGEAVAGWKLVPVEPTDEMFEAGYELVEKRTGSWGWDKQVKSPGDLYRAMIAASPTAPAAGEVKPVAFGWFEPIKPEPSGSLIERFRKGAERPFNWSRHAFPVYVSPPSALNADIELAALRKSYAALETLWRDATKTASALNVAVEALGRCEQYGGNAVKAIARGALATIRATTEPSSG